MEAPLTVIRGKLGEPQQAIRHAKPEIPSQRFRSLCAEIALPSNADTFLQRDQAGFFLGTFGYIFTDGLIRPEKSVYGHTDLNPLLRRMLERMEVSLSPAFSDAFDNRAERIAPEIRSALIFTARRVAFVTGDHIREFDITDEFVQEAFQVVEGFKQPKEFSPELRPPTPSIAWAFDVFRTRVGLN